MRPQIYIIASQAPAAKEGDVIQWQINRYGRRFMGQIIRVRGRELLVQEFGWFRRLRLALARLLAR